ncbi:hypothetical protein ACFWUQ_29215 [Streptomyces sp. NPDC058662]|uniref:hypothetical protein n=1 Tax=Streptomyces sp. NPDC058662 TaxID=3346583 RepID=UPI0036605CA6
MDEQGGAGGVPPHDGHDSGRTERERHHGEKRTDAADTDEASRLDRPEPGRGPGKGRGPSRNPGSGERDARWVGPRDEQEETKHQE